MILSILGELAKLLANMLLIGSILKRELLEKYIGKSRRDRNPSGNFNVPALATPRLRLHNLTVLQKGSLFGAANGITFCTYKCAAKSRAWNTWNHCRGSSRTPSR
jgi:hypothetical protein